MSWRTWLDNRIRRICREQTKIRGCAVSGSVAAVPFGKAVSTKIDLDATIEPDTDSFFTTDAGGNHHVVIPPNCGGRYILLALIDWTKEAIPPNPFKPDWTLGNANSGILYAFPAKPGNPPLGLPNSQLTSTPVVHARHTYQRLHWEGILDAGDELEFYVQQKVSDGEQYQSPDGQNCVIQIEVALNFALRRPGIQY
jgi:hypothetical protein